MLTGMKSEALTIESVKAELEELEETFSVAKAKARQWQENYRQRCSAYSSLLRVLEAEAEAPPDILTTLQDDGGVTEGVKQ